MSTFELDVFGAAYRSLRADHFHLFSLTSARAYANAAQLAEVAHKTTCSLHLLKGFLEPADLEELYACDLGPESVLRVTARLMKFPFVVIPELTDRQVERYHRHINSDASGWHRKWTESIWRRHQHRSIARLSGWTSDGDRQRRLIHFYDEYDVQDRSFILENAYLWVNWTLPEGPIEAYRTSIADGLLRGGWTRSASSKRDGIEGEEWRRDSLIARLEYCRVHREDHKRGAAPPPQYRNLDLTVITDGYRLPRGWAERPWRVFYDVGLRRVLPRGQPQVIEPEEIADYLPAQLELGCGPSIEAGIPHLSNLHRIYGVSHSDYRFVYRAEHDAVIELLASPETKYREMTDMYRACMIAGETDFLPGDTGSMAARLAGGAGHHQQLRLPVRRSGPTRNVVTTLRLGAVLPDHLARSTRPLPPGGRRSC